MYTKRERPVRTRAAAWEKFWVLVRYSAIIRCFSSVGPATILRTSVLTWIFRGPFVGAPSL